jgi:hypothetical protein
MFNIKKLKKQNPGPWINNPHFSGLFPGLIFFFQIRLFFLQIPQVPIGQVGYSIFTKVLVQLATIGST